MTPPREIKRLSVLGSTGSIGRSALSLVDLHPDRFQVVALAAGKNIELLYQQSLRYRPQLVAVRDPSAARQLRRRLTATEVLSGDDGVVEAAAHSDVDMVVAGIIGAAGLLPTYRALLEKKDVALANKETLVMAGELIMSTVEEKGVNLLPVDSEHCALHQCLKGTERKEVLQLVLTASGGPFFGMNRDELVNVTAEEALNHPTWRMGPKITIDSATLMNKGLEVIEAHHLFGATADQISIVVHPQSIVHSMVEFIDGTLLAQMSITDMRSALLYALSFPDRWSSNLPRLNLLSQPSLEFYPPDTEIFPSIRLAYQSLEHGQTYPAALNAANEVAVHEFLNGTLPFLSVPEVIEEVLNRHSPSQPLDIESVLTADREARKMALEVVRAMAAH